MLTFPLNAGTKIPAISAWSSITEDVPHTDNYGVLTGALSGVIVVDYDAYKAGTPDVLPDWAPDTFTVRTGRGGFHFYFKHPGFFVRNSASKVKPYTDVRGDGGYAVGPGSKVKDDETGIIGEYTVYKDTDVADLPEWLLDAIQGSNQSKVGVAVIPIDDTHPDYARRVELGRERCKTHVFHDGANTWEVALYLARHLELPRETCVELLWNEYNPRRDKPLSVKELLHKIDDAQSNKYVNTLPGPIPADLFGRKDKEPGTKRGYKFESGTMATSDKAENIEFANLIHHLDTHPDWTGVFRFNDVSQEIRAFDPPIKLDAEYEALSDSDVDRCIEIASYEGKAISTDVMNRAIAIVAKKHRYNPIVDYLESVKDKPHTGAIRRLCTEVLGSPESELVVRKWLMSAVRRAITPGIKADSMLVLQGKQKAGKSMFGEMLFSREYFSDQMPSNLADKEASQNLRGKWCIEFAEMASILSNKHSLETVRAFITRTEEYYRPPYGRNLVREKRRCVFIGTINDDEFLDDPYGERRYYIVPVKDEMDLELLASMRDQVWSEAYALAQTDEKHYLTANEEKEHNKVREIYSNIDPWTIYITSYLKGRTKAFTGEDIYRERIAKDSITAVEQLDLKLRKRMNNILRKLGCKRVHKPKGWIAPAEYQAMKPEGRFQKLEERAN